MALILYTIEWLALTYWWRMFYEKQYRLIAPQTRRKRRIIAMTVALIAIIVIDII